MEETNQKLKAADIIGSVFMALVMAGLLAVIIWQQLTISDLRVDVVEASHEASEETRDLMIDKYWAEDEVHNCVIKGNVLLDTIRALLKSYEERK